LKDFAASITGATFERIFSKGKQIFFDFGSGRFLNNHLLMRGRWRRTADRFLLLPAEIWIAFEVAGSTANNYMGQVLRIFDACRLEEHLNSLGPDIMNENCTEQDIARAFWQRPELLLDQGVVSGVGNVAKSESLFLAGLGPETRAKYLSEDDLVRLARSIMQVMWDSYRSGGRWTHRVYRRSGKHCFECGSRIVMIRQGQQPRSTYFCPRCQPES
jgi:endonuclease-8